MRVKDVQEIMGHADVKVTLNIYAEATTESKEKSIKMLNSNMKLL